MNWTESAGRVEWNIRPFINGRYCSSSSREGFDNVNPADESVLCRAPTGSAADIDTAVRVARLRFRDGCWSELPASRRADALLRLAELIVQHKTQIALLDTLEMGKPISAALYDAGSYAPHLLRTWAGFADKLGGTSAPLTARTLTMNVYEPRGVIGAITPWNFPTVNAVFKIAPALAAGNSIVLKPSEISPSSALKLAELALQAGIPEGVLNVVPGLGTSVGAALALHPDVDLLSFTGSTATGRKLMELSGRSNGKPLLLECGGKSPHLVFDDVVDLDCVADACVKGLVRNQGQVCTAHTRLIVQKAIYPELLERVIHRARRYRPENPLDERTVFGPLASPTQRDRVKRYVEQGLQAGAVAVLRGEIRERGGCFVAPTVFDRVSSNMPIVLDEIFGPVLCVQCFQTEEEALDLANGTEYGLAATVWTRDMGRGKRLAHAIKAGHVSIRTSGREAVDDPDFLSFEPRKASGFGVELGLEGLKSYSTLKSLSFAGA